MIAARYGHRVDLAGLRERFSISMAGARLTDIISFAEELQLNTRGVRIELEDLKYLQKPAILHWGLKHFVVLAKVRGNLFTIHDPASGRRTLVLKEVSKHFTGIALEISPSDDFTPLVAERRVKLSDVWGRISGLWSAAIQVVGLSLTLQVFGLVAPLFLQISVDQAISPGGSDFLLGLTIAFAGIYLITAFVMAARSWTILHFSTTLNYQMVRRLFSRVLRLPTSFFENRHVGDILSRMSSARTIQSTLTEGLASGLIDAFLGVLTLVVIYFYSPLACIIVVVTTLILVAINHMITERLRGVQEEMIAASAAEQSHMMESVRAASTIKLFGREQDRVSRWQSRYGKVMNATFSVGRYSIGQKFCEDLILSVQLLAITFVAVTDVSSGQMTIGMLAALLAYRQTFALHVENLLAQAIKFRLLKVHLGRLSDLIHTNVEDAYATDVVPPRITDGRIEFDQVSFRYSTGEPWVLKNACFEIPEGAFVALVGASGSGKSTAVRLLLGLQQPEEGSIRIGGKILSGPLVRTWRSSVAAVLQNDRLFSGSIAENIAFFDPSPDASKIQKAAAAADIHTHIESLPMGYYTPVGDMGSTLSGGQYQRVLLARAIYRNPKVLILDEGTANLDPESEARIVNLVASLKITRIVVAHRPALVERADIVFRVNNGVVERER